VLPTAAVGRWLVLLLSRLLSGHRWPDAAHASDAGIGHYQAPGWSPSSGQLSGCPPSTDCAQAAITVSMTSRACAAGPTSGPAATRVLVMPIIWVEVASD
jgi:hypothetical protein